MVVAAERVCVGTLGLGVASSEQARAAAPQGLVEPVGLEPGRRGFVVMDFVPDLVFAGFADSDSAEGPLAYRVAGPVARPA